MPAAVLMVGALNGVPQAGLEMRDRINPKNLIRIMPAEGSELSEI